MKILIRHVLLLIFLFGLSNSALFSSGISSFQVSHGKSYKGVSLRWKSEHGINKFIIFRSVNKKNHFTKLTETAVNYFLDTTCESGVEYYYKIQYRTNSNNKVLYSEIKSGYRLINVTERYSLSALVDQKSRDIQILSSVDKRRMTAIEDEYLSWLKIKFILFVSKPYFINNKVIVLTDFSNFTASPEQNTIQFYPDDESYALHYYGRRPFNILKRTNDNGLFNRLIGNSIAFAVYQGDVKIKDKQGRNKFVPKYEAIGLATQYFRYTDNWSSETILFSSENDKIMDQVRAIEEESLD